MSHTGRFYIVDEETGRKFCIEPISNKNRTNWGDVNPATKKVEGKYGKKYKGSVEKNESIISEENGFKNIKILESGKNPQDYINELLNKKVKI